MVNLPKHIIKMIHNVGKNVVWRCYGQEEITLDNTNESDNPPQGAPSKIIKS